MPPRILPVVLAASLAAASIFAGCSGEPAPTGVHSLRERLDSLSGTHAVVIVTVNDRVRVDGERMSPSELPDAFAKLAKRSPGRPVALVLQPGAKPEAETFVRMHAAKSGLGPVELVPVE